MEEWSLWMSNYFTVSLCTVTLIAAPPPKPFLQSLSLQTFTDAIYFMEECHLCHLKMCPPSLKAKLFYTHPLALHYNRNYSPPPPSSTPTPPVWEDRKWLTTSLLLVVPSTLALRVTTSTVLYKQYLLIVDTLHYGHKNIEIIIISLFWSGNICHVKEYICTEQVK